MTEVRSPLQGMGGPWMVEAGASVAAGELLLVVEAMKMEHEVRAPAAGTLRERFYVQGEPVAQGEVLAVIVPAAAAESSAAAPAAAAAAAAPATPAAPAAPAAQLVPLTGMASASDPAPGAEGLPASAASPLTQPDPQEPAARADLRRLQERLALTADAARPEAMARRHALGLRSARENLADLCDPGSFVEYGALAHAAQRSRRSEDDLQRNTPADGMVTGIGTVNAAQFGAERSRTAVLAYDATVLAGTQGMRNHQKTDRLLAVALRHRLPVVLFAEGGGGRPGDTDMPVVAGLHVGSFAAFAGLNGRVPVLGIAAGRCFAGNAALLGCCDVVIATEGSNIGMGGPAMVEGGGLGSFRPEEIGPSAVQHGNGVIDILVPDEAAAVAAARQYLSYFQGRTTGFEAPPAEAARDVVPENRLRAYDSRRAMEALADAGSLLPLRTGFGTGIHTALARIEGRPIGLMASNPLHLGGAIDADAADKGARFMQLCNAHGLPILSLVDTPGFMVGPAIEERAQVRHVSRLFIAAAHLRVPFFSVVLRKGYGLGAMAMAAGGFHGPSFTVSWPSGEFGGMGLEGAVRLGYRKELEALPEGPQRQALFDSLVARQYEAGQALNMAATLEIDAVIDPADTRRWVLAGLDSGPVAADDAIRAIDTW